MRKLYQINNNAFSVYTKESAYWAGFMAADGCVDKKNRFRVYLNIKDVGHLYKLKNFLNSEHKVAESIKFNRCSFELTNKKIVADIKKNYSVTPLKSYNLQYPMQMPRELDMHFIRGYWDGDGTLCESFSNKNSLLATFYASVVGSEDFILQMAVLIEEYLGKALPLVRSHPNGINATWKLNTKAAIELSKRMYANASEDIWLNRKYEIYKRAVLEDNRKTRDYVVE